MYKPLRNKLRELNRDEALRVIWNYCTYFNNNQEFDSDIEIHRKVKSQSDPRKIPIQPWELETLAREIIRNSSYNARPTDTLRKNRFFSLVVNELKSFENDSYGIYGDDKNILRHLYRMAHRQFPWQSSPASNPELVRYFKIYNHGSLKEVFKDFFGIDPLSFYRHSIAIFSYFLEDFFLNTDFNLDIPKLSKSRAEEILNLFSNKIEDIKYKIEDNEKFDHRFIYQFNPLRESPILLTNYNEEEGYICPLPTLFYQHFTSGVYYDLVSFESSSIDFGNSFGESFESYVGDVLKKSLEDSFEFYSESQYKTGKDLIKTPDWIICDNGSIIFTECKTKRVTLETKQSLYENESLKNDFRKLAEAIVQLYQRILEYQDGHFPQIEYDPELTIYPIVLTLENWFVGPEDIMNDIRARVEDLLKEENLSTNLITEMPYEILSAEDFEVFAQMINKYGIKTLLRPKVNDEEKRTWDFNAYLHNEFPDYKSDLDLLFPEIDEKLFLDNS